MKRQMTSSWLVNYANVHKQASYQDKLDGVYRELNPYYLLEWILFPLSEEEAESIRFSRSPGMMKNSYADFTDIFFNQIVWELAFRALTLSDDSQRLLHTSIHELKKYYGDTAWNDAVQQLHKRVQEMLQKSVEFEQKLEQELRVIEQNYKEKLAEIDVEFSEEPQSEEKKLQQLSARELFEQRKEAVPRKLLQKKYKEWPLVAYLYYRQWPNPKAHVDWLFSNLNEPKSVEFIEAIKHEVEEVFFRHIEDDEVYLTAFLYWFPAYASKTLLTVESTHIEKRQSWWLGVLQQLEHSKLTNEQKQQLIGITFRLKGIDEVMMKDASIPPYFHRLVCLALQDHERRRWLREVVILRYWDVFLNAFAEREYDYREQSWVLCLDPDSLEKKLIRGIEKSRNEAFEHVDLAFMGERCSEVFADGIREGLDVELMVPLFQYLTIHHIDFLYGYIQRTRELSQLEPILLMDEVHLHRIFSDQGVRAVAARKQVRPILLKLLAEVSDPREHKLLRKLSAGFIHHKLEMIQAWLGQRADLEPWPTEQARLLAQLLEVEWLGEPGKVEDEHEEVKTWLSDHSDWVRFEVDTQQPNMTYRIVKPGVQDLLTGRILVRVLVRAELHDSGEISSLLDDLKNL